MENTFTIHGTGQPVPVKSLNRFIRPKILTFSFGSITGSTSSIKARADDPMFAQVQFCEVRDRAPQIGRRSVHEDQGRPRSHRSLFTDSFHGRRTESTVKKDRWGRLSSPATAESASTAEDEPLSATQLWDVSPNPTCGRADCMRTAVDRAC